MKLGDFRGSLLVATISGSLLLCSYAIHKNRECSSRLNYLDTLGDVCSFSGILLIPFTMGFLVCDAIDSIECAEMLNN